jgi:hypothetical protein
VSSYLTFSPLPRPDSYRDAAVYSLWHLLSPAAGAFPLGSRMLCVARTFLHPPGADSDRTFCKHKGKVFSPKENYDVISSDNEKSIHAQSGLCKCIDFSRWSTSCLFTLCQIVTYPLRSNNTHFIAKRVGYISKYLCNFHSSYICSGHFAFKLLLSYIDPAF